MAMTRPTDIHPIWAAIPLLTALLGCEGSTLNSPEDAGPNQPPAASLSASPLEGIAPLEVALRLSCSDPDRDPVRHLLDADGKAGYEISELTTISVKRSFAETTDVLGLCRDEKGAESDQVAETVYVLNILTQRATILALTNVERQKVGAVALVEDQKLTEFAQAHAKDMAERGYFSHTTPEGKTFSDRLQEAGITNVYAGENIALNYSPEGAVTAWINSSGHFQNMTNSRFRKIGIGVYSREIKGQGHVYYVQVFTS
jgi:hypothetical protein